MKIKITKYLCLILILSLSLSAKEGDLTSCFKVKMNAISPKMSKIVLRNVFNEYLFTKLESEFPNKQVDWSQWTTEYLNYTDESGQERTSLEGCFDVTDISTDTKLIVSIMDVAMDRFKEALKHYSSKKSHPEIDKLKNEVMLKGYSQVVEDIIQDPEVQQAIKNASTKSSKN